MKKNKGRDLKIPELNDYMKKKFKYVRDKTVP